MTVVPLSEKPNPDQMLEHLDHLFGNFLDGVHDGLVELAWTVNGKNPDRAQLFELDQFEELVAKAIKINAKPNHNTYIGAALRKPGTPQNHRTKKTHFYASTVVWTDLDDEGVADGARARYRGCDPTFWVVTARKPHKRAQLWWRLDEPIRDPDQLENILGGLYRAFDGDKAVVDCSTLMRLGGSVNWSQKPGRIFETTDARGPDPEDNRARSYPVEQISKAFSDAPAIVDLDIGGKPTDVEACIDNIRRGHHLHVNSRDLIWQMVRDGSPDWVISAAMQALLTPVSDGGTISLVPSLITSARSKLEMPEPGRLETTPLELIDPRNWMTKETPERQWLVEDYIPMKHVTGIYGDGGSGKTLLTHQLLTSVATGKNWLGMPVRQLRGIGFFCEDYEDDLHINQDHINFALGLAYSDLGDMRVISRVGEDNILMSFITGNKGQRTELFEQLLTGAQEFGAQFVLIDTLADTFDGNEHVRGQARQFIANVCGRIAREIEGVVVVCAHPSIAGMKSGDGYGGNTAWSNTVRSRLYLSRPEDQDDDDADLNERVLSRKKANYAGLGEDLPLVWSEGVLLPNDQPAKSKEIDKPTQNQMLITIQAAWDDGNPLAEGYNSARYVGHMLRENFGLSKGKANKLVRQWLINGNVRSEMVNSTSRKMGLKVEKWFDLGS